ncbi:uncharacterized protein [Diadema setosum]|uniref:uncharacterized protein n=1 Tax=Diadema setosum TaxID=31175 RepID=UPI003B3A4055
MRLHEGRKIYKCERCSENFPTKWDLNKHVRAVHPGEVSCGKLIYKCEMCPNTFAKKWDLKRHRKLHSKEMTVLGNVKCDCCSRSYATDRNLEAHRKINIFKQGYVHAPKKGNVHGQNGLPMQFKKHCVCYICWKSCGTPYRLKKHMLNHAEKGPAKSYKSEVYKEDALESGNQDMAKTEESVITEASSQMQSAAGTLGPMAKVQSVSDRTDTSGKYNLSSHRNVSSTSSDECRVCGGHFVNLARHMRLHEGRKIYECERCSENFPTKWDLNRHVRAVHPGEVLCGQLIYKCDMCPKTFAKKWDLKRHRKLHSKEMSTLGNVKCDCCSRSYATDGNLEAHRKVNIFKQGYVHAPKKGNVHGQNGMRMQFPKHCVCCICWKSCGTPYRLKKHMLIHAEKGPGKSYNSEVLKEDALDSGNQDTVKIEESVITEASSQMQSAAGTLGPMAKVQSVCDRTDTSDEYNFTSHRNLSSTSSDLCHICGGRFVNLARHMRLHEGRKIYKCERCSENFPTKWDLNKHVRAVHPGEVSCGQLIYKCEMCPKTFIKKWDLKRHRKLHSKEMSVLGNVKCDCCSRSYATDGNLEAHRKINFFKQGYVHAPKKGNVHGQNGLPMQFPKHCVCHICWKSCGTPYRLKKHMLIHAEKGPGKSYNSEVLKGETKDPVLQDDENSETRTNTPEQSELLKKFHDAKSDQVLNVMCTDVSLHNSTHAINNTKCLGGENKTNTGPYRPSAGQAIPGEDKKELDFPALGVEEELSHRVMAHKHLSKPQSKRPKYFFKREQCKVCGKFIYRHKMIVHMRVHTGEKPFRCKVCSKCFARNGNLKRHMSVHGPEYAYYTEYTCNICHKSLGDRFRFFDHMRKHGCKKFCLPVRQEQCKVCGKSMYRHHMKAHMRGHTGEKPFRCRICSKCFAENGTLKRHMSVHGLPHAYHTNYTCSICHKSWGDRYRFYNHMRNHSFQEFSLIVGQAAGPTCKHSQVIFV